MGATSVTGAGTGAAKSSRGPDGGNSLNGVYIPLVSPQIMAAGHLFTVNSEGSGNWRQRITFETPLFGDPHSYVVMCMQDDYGSDDGRNSRPPHVEKLDGEGNNETDGYTGGFGGFILHTGDSENRRFMWTVIKVGNTPAYTNNEFPG